MAVYDSESSSPLWSPVSEELLDILGTEKLVSQLGDEGEEESGLGVTGRRLDGSLHTVLRSGGRTVGGNVPGVSFSFSVMASQAQSPFINSSFSLIDSVK